MSKNIRALLHNFAISYDPSSVESRKRDIDNILSLICDLLLAEKNMPPIMLSEYGKGQNDMIDHLVEKIKCE